MPYRADTLIKQTLIRRLYYSSYIFNYYLFYLGVCDTAMAGIGNLSVHNINDHIKRNDCAAGFEDLLGIFVKSTLGILQRLWRKLLPSLH